ncbi:MAG: AAA family ATPase [Saccharofermentans sp.]|nr:AAA family ATPase [Saccharofermentans sp.]
MDYDKDTGRLKNLTIDDSGQKIEDCLVTAVRIFCARTSSGFVSFLTDSGFVCAGRSGVDIAEGMTYRISGVCDIWNNKPQIKLRAIKEEISEEGDKALIASFLEENFEGIGKIVSRALADKYGIDVLKILSQSPDEAVTDIRGLSKETAMKACDKIVLAEDYFFIAIKLKMLGLSKAQIDLCFDMGLEDADEIKKNPYELYRRHIAGFETCDRIASSQDLEKVSSIRAQVAIGTALTELTYDSGSTCFGRDEVFTKVMSLMNQSSFAKISVRELEDVFAMGVGQGVEAKDIVCYKFEDGKCKGTLDGDKDARYASYEIFKAETSIKRRLEEFMARMVKVPLKEKSDKVMNDMAGRNGISLDEAQLQALYLCISSHVCVITGGPGTGKTTIMGILSEYFSANGISCALAAPTGRAAKRLSEATGKKATTIHRLLEVTAISEDSDKMIFNKNRQNPIDARVIIVDEMSMVDTILFDKLLDAAKDDATLIFIGDPDQLPAVGCGNILADLLSCRFIPSVKLDIVHRQQEGSNIAANAYRILEGRMPVSDDKEFTIMKADSDEQAADICLGLASKFADTDYVCLTPTKKDNVALGTVKLNSMMQQLITEEGSEYIVKGRNRFAKGDRVMQTRNNYSVEWLDPETGEERKGVFNGEIGKVFSIDPIEGAMTVEFDDGKFVRYKGKSLDEVDLAYAITVHKAQGCEFDNVIIALGKMNALLYRRRLLYTAVTRSKKKVVIIDSGDALARFIRSGAYDARATTLKGLLHLTDIKKGLT